MSVSILIHAFFALYFLLRLFIVAPLIPRPFHPPPPFSYAALLLFSLLPLPPLLCFPKPAFPYALLSYLLSAAVAFRFAHDAALRLSSSLTTLRLPVLLLCRIDVLAYLLFISLSTFSQSSSHLIIVYSITLTLFATCLFIQSLHQRAVQQHNRITPSIFLRLILSSLTFNGSARSSTQPVHAPPSMQDASAFSLLSFGWISPLVLKGYTMPLEDPHLPPLSPRFSCAAASHLFDAAWQRELPTAHLPDHSAQPSLIRALFNAYGNRVFWCAGLKLVSDVTVFASPILLRMVIQHFQNRENGLEGVHRGVILAFALFGSYLLQSVVLQQFFNLTYVLYAMIRGSLMNAIFSKSTRISLQTRAQSTSGKIQNLMSTDCRTIAIFSLGMHDLWGSLEQIVVAMILLINFLGWLPSLSAFSMAIFAIPLQTMLFKHITKLRTEKSERTDDRIKHISEAIKGIKLVKLYGWEVPFIRRIRHVRDQELGLLRKVTALGACNRILTSTLSTATTIVAFAVYVLEGNPLDAAVVFPAIAIFRILQPSLLYFPNLVMAAARCKASISRIRTFLTAQELTPLVARNSGHDAESLTMNRIDVFAERATFSWDPDSDTPTLKMNENIEVRAGSLVAIVGSTGSGKSTLLSGLLGEVPILSGRVRMRPGRTLSFCDQVPFIQNATLRDNILFGKPFVESFYHATVQMTALIPDIEDLPAGDLTEIGSRGCNLSGGQRARVALARAVYADADIVLMDDPLSAVDAEVSRVLFDDCIVSGLQGKTRMLVTNHLACAASDNVDSVIVVKQGVVVESGSRQDLLADQDSQFSHLVRSSIDTPPGATLVPEPNTLLPGPAVKSAVSVQNDATHKHESFARSARMNKPPDESSALLGKKTFAKYNTASDGRLTTDERKKEGRVSFRHYRLYLTGMGLCQWVVPFVVSLLSFHLFSLAKDVWLSMWTEEETNDTAIRELSIFFVLGLMTIVASAGGVFTLLFGMFRASVRLHDRFLVSVFGAPSSFFDSTPQGRIVNRFSSDMEKVDSSVGMSLAGLLRVICSVFFSLSLILWTLPAFAVVIIPVAGLCFYIQGYYRRSIVDLRRLEAMSYSPLYSNFTEMLDGIVTIRAFNDVSRSLQINSVYIDKLSKTSFATSSVRRWLNIRLNILSNVLILAATIMAVVLPSHRVSTSLKGLMLSYAIGIMGSMRWTVKQFTNTESQLSAVERIAEYGDASFEQEETGSLKQLLQERPYFGEESKPMQEENCWADGLHSGFASSFNPGWLRSGDIDYRNVEMRYKSELDPVLRDVSFAIRAGEHVGIVGRTGAGKTTAIHSLFRLYELENGKVSIDGADISSLSLYELRPSIGIIPQESVCFSGTVRSNLDMFGKHDDDSVQQALELCGIQQCMREKISLDYEVMENGSNFSVGQRQLLCLGRALLQSSRVLVLDEATSNVSDEVDMQVQSVIRNHMKNRTILKIAHRLRTVIHCDRILVMDRGRVVETGSPKELLSIRSSRFSLLVDETGEKFARGLRLLVGVE